MPDIARVFFTKFRLLICLFVANNLLNSLIPLHQIWYFPNCVPFIMIIYLLNKQPDFEKYIID